MVDNFERALEAFEKEKKDSNKAMEGVQMIHNQLLGVLKKNGVEKMKSFGEVFNPNFHEAIFEIDHKEIPPGHVGQVLKEGYMIKERVLRAALVGIVKK